MAVEGPSGESTFGQRLTVAMAFAGMQNGTLAKRAGVHEKTVSKWRSDKQLPDPETQDLIATILMVDPRWLRMNQGRPPGSRQLWELLDDPQSLLRQPLVRESPLPRQLDMLAAEFELEAMKAGADDEDMRYIKMAFRSPEAVQLYRGGYAESLGVDEQRVELESLIEMLRVWLKGRIRRRNATKRRK